jgi:hypothetical protein
MRRRCSVPALLTHTDPAVDWRRWVALRRAHAFVLCSSTYLFTPGSPFLREARVAIAQGTKMQDVITTPGAPEIDPNQHAYTVGLFHFTGVPELFMRADVAGLSVEGGDALFVLAQRRRSVCSATAGGG